MKKLAMLIALLLVCSIAAIGQCAGSYTINIASTFAPTGPVQQRMEEFKTNMETASEGRV